jgi:hypothetical protein
MKNRPGSVELNLLYALQWEQYDFHVSDHKKKWDLSEEEARAVNKWISARIKDIKDRCL